MTFSDWITIVSIVIGVLIGVFKFDEREIIRLKRVNKYAWPSIVLLIFSGLSAYFNSNPHPEYMNFVWRGHGLNPGAWPIIWMVLSAGAAWQGWGTFVNQPPTQQLIDHYIDILKISDPDKFSILFRKYERHFFNNVEDDAWLRYQRIFIIPKWWVVAPIYFSEIIKRFPNRFFKMDREVLKTLIRVQFSSINTPMMEELERWPNEEQISEASPLLNIFLATKGSIRKSRDRNILLPTVRDAAMEYFNTLDFLEHDKRILLLKPVDNSSQDAIPVKLMVFYYINFIHWYWISVIRTKAPVAGFYQTRFGRG